MKLLFFFAALLHLHKIVCLPQANIFFWLCTNKKQLERCTLPPRLLLSDYCHNYNYFIHSTESFADTKWSKINALSFQDSRVPLIRLSTFGHHTQLNQTKRPSRVGAEQSGFSVPGMERMMLVCPPLPTAVLPNTLGGSFTRSVSATETTHQRQVCLPSSSILFFFFPVCIIILWQ